MNPGTLLIRADAGAATGSGHVMRCLALAQGWRQAGGDVVFAMAETTPAIERRITEENCRVVRVSAAPASSEDLRSTRSLISSESPSWIVLDGYRFQSVYREEIKQAGHAVLVLDDNGGHDCCAVDLLLNQNVHAGAKMYPQRAPRTRLLLGPRYAILRAEFAAYRDHVRQIPENGKRILVTMGGSDPSDFALRVVPELAGQLGEEAEIRVVVGGSTRPASGPGSLFPAAVQVLRDVRNMAESMAWADLAIAGAGSTCWEMCCLGLPAIIVEAADNQCLLARKLDAMGVAVNAGPAQQVDCKVLAGRARQILSDQEARGRMSRSAQRLVDGRGTERVLTFMSSELHVRSLARQDCRMLWEWANDPVARAASFSSEAIPWESHQQWFERQIESDSARIYIIEEAAEPVGQVRCQIAGKRATLSVNIAPERRGQGLGQRVLLLGIEELWNTTAVETIEAYVKPANTRSLDLFRSAAFEENGVSEVRGQPAVWFVLKRWGSEE